MGRAYDNRFGQTASNRSLHINGGSGVHSEPSRPAERALQFTECDCAVVKHNHVKCLSAILLGKPVNGYLNSSPARYLIDSYVVKVQISTHVLNNIGVSAFSVKNKVHLKLARLSKQCHGFAEADNAAKLGETEEELDDVAAKYWDLTDVEVREMRRYAGASHADATGNDEE